MDSLAHAISLIEQRSLSPNHHAPHDFENFAFAPLTSTANLDKFRSRSTTTHRVTEIFGIGITRAVRMRARTP